jgi:hypothetical protein
MGGVDVYAGTRNADSQLSSMEYADGTRVQLEVRGLYTNAEDKIMMGLLVYGSEGWMHLGFDDWATFFGRKNEPGERCSEEETNVRSEEFRKFGNDGPIHYANFIDTVRSRKVENLHTNIEEGHWSAAMCHLSNIAYRTGRTLVFDQLKGLWRQGSRSLVENTGRHSWFRTRCDLFGDPRRFPLKKGRR